MFLRRIRQRKEGREYVYWALCQTVQTPKGPRQRHVAYLGKLKRSEESGWSTLASHLNQKDRPSPSLFEPLSKVQEDESWAQVKISGIKLARAREFGRVWMGWGLWRLLGLDQFLAGLIPRGREDVPWQHVAAILAIARLCDPGSEHRIEQVWYPKCALDDLLDVPVEKVHTDRLYAAMDRLLPHKEAIERHLKDRMTDLFELKCDVLLYDITSTYFEGLCEKNDLAKRGYSRDSRPDCKQVCIALVVTPDGIPLHHEVFEGNKHDSTTVQSVVQTLESKYGKARRIWVMDRGMVSQDNIAFIKERDAKYIVGTPKSMLHKFEQHLTKQDWLSVREGVDVKLVPCPDGTQELYVLARSADRVEKEKAMNERFKQQLETGLTKMAASAARGTLKSTETANRRLGRMLQRCWRASKAFDVSIEPVMDPQSKAKITVTWTANAQWASHAENTQGCYILRTNLTGMDPKELWRHYIQLTEAEAAFRLVKEEMRIRPVWHHGGNRTRTHIFICFLAYAMWKTLGQLMKRSGLGDCPRVLMDELGAIKCGDLELPARTHEGIEHVIKLRCVVEADPALGVLLQRLGIPLPRRLEYKPPRPNPTQATSKFASPM